jgi:hypothetical protein
MDGWMGRQTDRQTDRQIGKESKQERKVIHMFYNFWQKVQHQGCNILRKLR